jgi:Fe-S cluster assembly protein SufD
MSSPAFDSLLRAAQRAHERAAARGPGWLAALRAAGLEAFGAQGLPTTQLEDWRFTSLEQLRELELEPADPAGSALAPERLDAARAWVGPALRAVLLDGHWDARALEPSALPAGVRLGSLARALEDGGARALGGLADPKGRALSALNTAAFEDGAYVELAPGAAPERPIHLIYAASAQAGPRVSHPRALIVAGPRSRALVIEHHVGDASAAGLCNPLTEIALGEGAQLEHVVLQDQGEALFQLGALATRQERGSRLRTVSLALGAALARLDVHCVLADEGAALELGGLYLARGRQLLDHHITVDHAAARTASTALYKGIVDERGHGVFHGRIGVRPRAVQTDASQTHRALLLADGATVNAKPQLEIYVDDVKCSHGNSIGQLDPDALFYLRARGLDEAQARALLTLAFASEVSGRVGHAPLREALERRVLEWLPRERRP